MKPVYLDLHIHTSLDPNHPNENYDVAELVSQIKQFNGDSPFMISLTDHNMINKDAYLKAKSLEGMHLILGVELNIKYSDEEKSYHCHIYFNVPVEADVIDQLNGILNNLYPDKRPNRTDVKTPDIQEIINSFDKYDFILLPHGSQKHGAFNYSIREGESLDNAINRSIYYNQFDGFTARSNKGLEMTHKYFKRLGISEFINLLTCSDNYSPCKYPQSIGGIDDDFVPTWMFAEPTFDGLRLSLSESTRLVYNTEKPVRQSDYISHVSLQNENIDVDVDLSEGLNVVIGGSSSGKTLFVDSVVKAIRGKFDGSNYLERYGVDKINVVNTSSMTPYYVSQNFIADNINSGKSIDKIEILSNIFPPDDEISRNITSALNKLNDVISKMMQYVESIENCEQSLKAIPHPGHLIVTGPVKKNAVNALLPKSAEEALVEYPEMTCQDDMRFLEQIRAFLKENPLAEAADQEIDAIERKLTHAYKAFELFEGVSEVITDHKYKIDKVLKDELGQKQNRITNRENLLIHAANYVAALKGFYECKKQLVNMECSFKTRVVEARGHKLSIIKNFVFDEKVLIDALRHFLKQESGIGSIADVTPWSLRKEYFKGNMFIDSYDAFARKIYSQLMDLNTTTFKIVSKEGQDFENLSPGWKTAILLDLILGYDKDNAPIIIDQPEDNLAVRYINSTLTETIKDVKWQKQVIMVSHNATIPMMADAQTIVVCENDGSKITIRSAALEGEVFGQKVLDYIADQTDGGRTSIKKRVKKYNFKKYNTDEA